MKEYDEMPSSDPKTKTLRIPYRPTSVKATLVTYDSVKTEAIKNIKNEELWDNLIATYWG